MVRVLLVVLLLVVGGCTAGGDPTVAAPGQPPRPPSVAEASPSAGEVPPALAFSAETVQGAAVEGASYAGQDLLVWFWAPW